MLLKKPFFKIGIIGATGIVGSELLKILDERNFPIESIKPFASKNSIGKKITYRDKTYKVEVLSNDSIKDIDIAFFDASDLVSKKWALAFAENNTLVIDNSATFRMDSDVELIVPEINGNKLIKKIKEKNILTKDKIISGPNCSTVELVMALKPIQLEFGLKKVFVATYQSTSGAGNLAKEELLNQTKSFIEKKEFKPKHFSNQIAFNTIPHIGGFLKSGYTSEENKILHESRKILEEPLLQVSVTAVRIPTLYCHGEAVFIETKKQVDILKLKEKMETFHGICLLDDHENNIYPMNETHPFSKIKGATGRDPVYVGRIRKDLHNENSVNMWIMSDNIRKGASLNAVQIAETIIKNL